MCVCTLKGKAGCACSSTLALQGFLTVGCLGFCERKGSHHHMGFKICAEFVTYRAPCPVILPYPNVRNGRLLWESNKLQSIGRKCVFHHMLCPFCGRCLRYT